MNAAHLLTETDRAGVALHAEGDRLRVEAKPGTLTADLRAKLIAGKPALIALLLARARLLALAETEGLPADLVIDMAADDLAAWARFAEQADGTDDTLRKCLRTLAEGVAVLGLPVSREGVK